MYLKRLEIQGFKSFAKRTILEFDKGITAVVGPNGSGKSNVADCLRWVLGEQSIKNLRGKKSDDVIFAGSDQRPRGGLAEVFATFDNRDHRIPVDASEVSIGRRIDRSGESEYLINGNKVRLLDIVDLVLKSNIGTSRYTVIGQGTIDQFILQGASGVKDLIDEASGVKTYYIRREKTLRRMEQTAQNLMRAEDLIAEIEPRLKSLRRLAKRAEARVALENQLRELLLEHYSFEYHHLNHELQSLQQKLSAVEQDRKHIEQNIEQLLTRTEATDAGRQQQIEALKHLQEEQAKLQHEKNKLVEHLSMLRGKVESLKSSSVGDPESLRANLHSTTNTLAEHQRQLHQVIHEETAAKSQVSEATSKLADINRRLETVYAQLSDPHEINTDKVVDELSQLEVSFGQFYHVLENGTDVNIVLDEAARFKSHFERFRVNATQELTSPQSIIKNLKGALQQLLADKERIQSLLASVSVEVSKMSVSREFLEKQIEVLEQDKRRIELELSQSTSTGSEFFEQVQREEERIKAEIAQIEQRADRFTRDMQELLEVQNQVRKEQQEHDKMVRDLQTKLSFVRDSEAGYRVEMAKVETLFQGLTTEVHQSLGASGIDLVKQTHAKEKSADLVDKIARLKHQLEMVGGIDELTMKEHEETEGRYSHLTSQIHDLKTALDDLKSVMDELDTHIASTFNDAFHRINEKFEYYFHILFNGGKAHLSLVKDEIKEEDEAGQSGDREVQETAQRREEKLVKKYEQSKGVPTGVEIKATPPGKKLSTIQALSGGERALTSIALLCSLLSSFPSPFVMLDEVDAALDEANTIRFGQILGTLSHQTQFITVTHNRETMSQANTIYGITMGDDGISKLLSIKFDQATVYAK